MIRSLIAIVAGQLSITLLKTFSRVVVGLYFRTDITMTGISHLPSLGWMYFLTALNILFGLFGALMICSLSKGSNKIEILVLIMMTVVLGLFSYQFFADTEPLWYLTIAPLLTISGIFWGFKLKQNLNSEVLTHEA